MILGACLRSIVRYIDIEVISSAICVCDKSELVSPFAELVREVLRAFRRRRAQMLGSRKV